MEDARVRYQSVGKPFECLEELSLCGVLPTDRSQLTPGFPRYTTRRAKHDVPPCNRAKNPVTGLSKVTFDWTFTPFEVIVLGNFTLDGIVTGLLRGRTACNARRVSYLNLVHTVAH